MKICGAITNSCNPYFRDVFRRMIQKKGKRPTRLKIRTLVWKSGGIISPVLDLARHWKLIYRMRKVDSFLGLFIGDKAYKAHRGSSPIFIRSPLEKARTWWRLCRWQTLQPRWPTAVLLHSAHRKKIGNDGALDIYKERHYTTIDSAHFKVAVDAMQNVVQAGTGLRSYLPDIIVCGKTGSVENDPNPEHSVFIAFAHAIIQRLLFQFTWNILAWAVGQRHQLRVWWLKNIWRAASTHTGNTLKITFWLVSFRLRRDDPISQQVDWTTIILHGARVVGLAQHLRCRLWRSIEQ